MTEKDLKAKAMKMLVNAYVDYLEADHDYDLFKEYMAKEEFFITLFNAGDKECDAIKNVAMGTYHENHKE